jgi:hypothetical protein
VRSAGDLKRWYARDAGIIGGLGQYQDSWMQKTQQGMFCLESLLSPSFRFACFSPAPALSTLRCPPSALSAPPAALLQFCFVGLRDQPTPDSRTFSATTPLSATAGFPTVGRGFSGDLEPMSVQLVQLFSGPRCPESADKTDSHSGTRTTGHHDWLRLHDRSFQTWLGQVQSRSTVWCSAGYCDFSRGLALPFS